MSEEYDPLVLEETQRHIVFYSKGFYKKSRNKISDIAHIIARGWAVNAAYLDHADIYDAVLGVFFKVVRRESQERFWQEIFSRIKDRKPLIHRDELIEHLLGRIAICQVHEGNKILIELGEPDYTVLSRSME